MTTEINISELVNKVESMILTVREGGRSQYHTITVGEDDITIRVADHMANPERVTGKTMFFIVESNRDGNHISKKTFASIAGRIYLDENNCDENGYDIEYLLDYEIN